MTNIVIVDFCPDTSTQSKRYDQHNESQHQRSYVQAHSTLSMHRFKIIYTEHISALHTTYTATHATFVVQLHGLVELLALLEVHGALDHQRRGGLERVPAEEKTRAEYENQNKSREVRKFRISRHNIMPDENSCILRTTCP